MTYATAFGEHHLSQDVQLGDLGGNWLPYMVQAGPENLTMANIEVNAAEARGAPPTQVKAWRDLLAEAATNYDVDSIKMILLEAPGWTAAGNAGPVTQRAADAAQRAIDDLKNAGKATGNALMTAAWVAGGLALFYVVLKARS